MTRARALAIAAVFIVATWVSLWARFRAQPPADAPPRRHDLRAWDFLGCLELSADPWTREGGEGTQTTALPRYLSLVADSVDEWGRAYDTYRARPLDGDERQPYRWFVRADTLWIVWSDEDSRGGVALRAGGGTLAGRARVTRRSDSTDASARVEGWSVNCWTRERRAPDRLRR